MNRVVKDEQLRNAKEDIAMAEYTDDDRIRDTLKEMQSYFELCAINCQLGSVAYRLYSKYVATLDKVMKRIKEDEHD